MTALTSVGANTVAMTGGLLVSHDAIGSWATQGMQRQRLSVVSPPPPALPAPTLHGFTCYIDAIGSAITGAASLGCGRPAIRLLIWTAPVFAP